MNDGSKNSNAKSFIQWQGKKLAVDKEGFLLNHYEWNHELATEMARLEGIQLNHEHWELINYLREYHEDYDISPPMRMMVTLMKNAFGEKVSSHYLQALFPLGPVKQGSRFAGLPKPKNCL